MTRARDVADNQENNGGGVPPFVAGKNKVINGDFGVWQRGTSFVNLASNTYTADRWICNTANSTIDVSRSTFTPGTAPVAGYESTYFATIVTEATDAEPQLRQRIEDVRTFAGQTVTVSFWAKSTITTDALRWVRFNQTFGTGGSAGVITLTSPFTLTSSWARYSATLTLPSIAGKTIGANSYLQIGLDAKQNTAQTLDIWGVQLEAGNVATPFTTATGTIQGELAACQRYYQTDSVATSGASGYLMQGVASSRIVGNVFFPVQMRTTPTVTLSTGSPYWESVPYITVGSLTGATVDGTKLSPSGGILSVNGTFGTTPVQSYPGLLGQGQIRYSAEL